MWQEPLAIPGGDRQSPIDIIVRKSVFDSQLRPLKTQYDPRSCQQIWNNGYSFLVEYDDTNDKSSKLRNNVSSETMIKCYLVIVFYFYASHWNEI